MVVKAQVYGVNPLPEKVVSGDDFGFRVVGEQNGTLVGTLVIKANGKWIDARIVAGPTIIHPAR